ncbi:ATP-binding protein [Turicibacter sanguinis]|uniref:ATP-binding protein n=1 Tax=Turicibacter sanguinis TaxID=154288 RepID=UPI0021D50CA0|nr:ATP-binding protein [Turicibacter sanguinis]MCU7192171.1 ATP-binding protein [Turicibacter sanguinis]
MSVKQGFLSANYHTCGIDEFDSNPLISALPPFKNKANVFDILNKYPKFSDSDIELDAEVRMQLVNRLKYVFQPLPVHYNMWLCVNNLIREGYISRNPFDKSYISHVHQMGKNIILKEFDNSLSQYFNSSAGAALIIGYSGMGKTTSLNLILNEIPQVITHTLFESSQFIRTQVTWLKIDAPFNCSIKGLVFNFFMELDKVLGTNYFEIYSKRRLTLDELLAIVSKTADNVSLGTLIIDEFQHVKGKGMKQLLNFFVTLLNVTGIPVIFVGTNAVLQVLESEMRIARRITGNEMIKLENMKFDEEFRLFVNGVWSFQYQKEYIPLSSEILQAIYEETQGITDLIIKLLIAVQREVIKTGYEKIDVKIIQKVATKQFSSLRPILHAIRTNNLNRLSMYEDLMPLS